MSFTDLLTISMPVYERKEFFRTALESALNQTVKCKVIVVDNCSSHDLYKKICKEKDVPYYRNEKNLGMARNFAKVFELADTKYVMNLQDDDQLKPNYVESFLAALDKYPDLDMYYPNFERRTSEGIKPHKHTLPFGYMENGNKIIEYGIKYKMGYPYMASVIKRSTEGGFHKNYVGSGSHDWIWIYEEADKFTFYGDSQILYTFRDHDNQDTKNNWPIYRLTLPYIYDEILYHKVSDPKLKKKASKNAFWELIHLKALADNKSLDKLKNGDTVYEKYLNNKLKQSNLLRTIFAMPKGIIYFVFKTLQKVGLSG